MKEVTIRVPLALQELIIKSNQLLKQYQANLQEDIQAANIQMMQILRLDPAIGWKLDIENMVYTRPKTEDELAKESPKAEEELAEPTITHPAE